MSFPFSFTIISEALKHVLIFKHVSTPIKVNSPTHMLKIKYLHKCFDVLGCLSKIFSAKQIWSGLALFF